MAIEHKITSQEQLDRWVAGESLHRAVEGLKGGECCPDFSCCKPQLLADEPTRVAFAAAGPDARHKFLSIFLRAMVEMAAIGKKVHVTGGDPGGES